MEDTTKVGIATGVITALVGGIAAFISYKQGHSTGHAEGIAKGFKMGEEKFKGLREKYEETLKQIQELKEFKAKIENDLNGSRAIVEELYNYLKEKGYISEETYSKLTSNLWQGRFDDFSTIMDDVISAEQEACNVINGDAGKGRVDIQSHGESLPSYNEVRIVFSDTVCGVYKYPQCKEALLPNDEILFSSPKLLERIKSLIPEWRFEYREAPVAPVEPMACAETPWLQAESISNVSAVNLSQRIERQLRSLNESRFDVRQMGVLSREKYDYECICRNALRDLDGQYVLCDKVEFRSKYLWANLPETVGGLDYEHGCVTSKWLDDYLWKRYNEVKDAISAFLTLLSDADKERMEKNRVVLMDIAKKLPVFGAIEFSGDTPCVRFSDDICIRIAIPDLPIYFEGDNFDVHTNVDLRNELQELVSNWKDMPVSDSRIDGILSSFRYVNGYPRKGAPLPAEGAVREFLRFKDAARVLCDNILHEMIGKQICCQAVEIKRVDGVIVESSEAVSNEITKVLSDAVASVQQKLNDFAKSRNAVLYCYGDLFPELKTPRYYEKWRMLDRAATMPQLRVGDIVSGVVRNIKEYGAFIDFAGTSGLLHISEISNAFVKDVNQFLKVGQCVSVKIISIDNSKGRISLSMRKLCENK